MMAGERISFRATGGCRFAGGSGLNRSIHNGPGLDRPGSFRRTSHSALRTGFTLIELLVVIAIISLLVSILLPSLTKAKELAKSVVCMSNEKAIGLAVQFYAEDYDDLMIPSSQLCIRKSDGWLVWMEAHERLIDVGYIDDKETFFCPSVGMVDWWGAGQARGGGYSVNFHHAHPTYDSWTPDPMRRSDFTRANGVLSFVECLTYDAVHPYGWPYYAWCEICFGPPIWSGFISDRHNEKNNVLFADGHVEPVSYDDIITNVNDIWGHHSR